MFARTKFEAPPLRSSHVHRLASNAAIDAGAGSTVTLVVGLPGAGKTVAIADWAGTAGAPSAWMRCDERDRDPLTFWSALATAIDHRWPGTADRSLEQLALAVPDLDSVAATLSNALAELDDGPVLIVDDFHLVAGPVEATFAAFIGMLPAPVRVIVASRTEPDLLLHRLRARQQLVEVRPEALRLTDDEGAAMLGNLGVDLTFADVRALVERTEGWAAGLQLAAVSLRDERRPAELLQRLAESRRTIGDYLFLEALDRQPEHLRRFLLEASILEEFDAPTCAAVLGGSDATELIAEAQSRNLFLVRQADGDTYRFHHLFRDLLQEQLRLHDPEREVALHRAAAARFEKTNEIGRSIRHLVAAGDHDDALVLVNDKIVTGYLEGGPQSINLWLAEFDDDFLEGEPRHMLAFAQAMVLGGAVAQSEQWLRRAHRHDDRFDDAMRRRAAIVDTYLTAYQGRTERATELLAEIRRMADADTDDHVATLPLVACQLRLWCGDLDGAHAEHARSLAGPRSYPTFEDVLMAGQRAQLLLLEGAIDEARVCAERAIEAVARAGVADGVMTAASRMTVGDVLFEQGRLDEADEPVAAAFALAERVRPPYAFQAQVRLGRIALARGDVAGAVAAIGRARTYIPDEANPLHDEVVELAARTALAVGDLTQARIERRDVAQPRVAVLLDARLHLAAGEPRDAAAVLEQAPASALPAERLERLLLLARARAASTPDERAGLRDAVELAASHGYVQRVIDHARHLEPRLSQLVRGRGTSPFDRALRDALDQLTLLGPSDRSTRAPFVPLSAREVEVLRCLPSRRTIPEIAAELFVSANTVKTHAKSIYRKLGVTTRNDAIRVARDVGLL